MSVPACANPIGWMKPANLQDIRVDPAHLLHKVLADFHRDDCHVIKLGLQQDLVIWLPSFARMDGERQLQF